MSKRKGDFRSKIDSILTDGDDEGAAAGGGPDAGRNVLADLVRPTTETKLDEIEVSSISMPAGRARVQNVSALLDSVRAVGVLQPLMLRPVPGGYEVVDGGRRLVAAQRAGLRTVPAVVRTLSDADALATASVDRPTAPPVRVRKPAARSVRPVARIAKKSAARAVTPTRSARTATAAAGGAPAGTAAAKRKVPASPISAPKRGAGSSAGPAAKTVTASRARATRKAAAVAAPKVAAKSAPKQVAKAAPKQVVKAAPKSVAKAAAKAARQPVAKAAPKLARKVAVKAAPKVRPAPKAARTVAGKAAPKVKPVVRAIPKPAPKAAPKLAVKAVPKARPAAKAAPPATIKKAAPAPPIAAVAAGPARRPTRKATAVRRRAVVDEPLEVFIRDKIVAPPPDETVRLRPAAAAAAGAPSADDTVRLPRRPEVAPQPEPADEPRPVPARPLSGGTLSFPASPEAEPRSRIAAASSATGAAAARPALRTAYLQHWIFRVALAVASFSVANIYFTGDAAVSIGSGALAAVCLVVVVLLLIAER